MTFIVEETFFHSIRLLLKIVIMKVSWTLSNAFLHLLRWSGFYLYVNAVYNINWFVFVWPTLNPWGKPQWIMACRADVLNSDCCYFIEDFHIWVRQRYRHAAFLRCLCLGSVSTHCCSHEFESIPYTSVVCFFFFKSLRRIHINCVCFFIREIKIHFDSFQILSVLARFNQIFCNPLVKSWYCIVFLSCESEHFNTFAY